MPDFHSTEKPQSPDHHAKEVGKVERSQRWVQEQMQAVSAWVFKPVSLPTIADSSELPSDADNLMVQMITDFGPKALVLELFLGTADAVTADLGKSLMHSGINPDLARTLLTVRRSPYGGQLMGNLGADFLGAVGAMEVGGIMFHGAKFGIRKTMEFVNDAQDTPTKSIDQRMRKDILPQRKTNIELGVTAGMTFFVLIGFELVSGMGTGIGSLDTADPLDILAGGAASTLFVGQELYATRLFRQFSFSDMKQAVNTSVRNALLPFLDSSNDQALMGREVLAASREAVRHEMKDVRWLVQSEKDVEKREKAEALLDQLEKHLTRAFMMDTLAELTMSPSSYANEKVLGDLVGLSAKQIQKVFSESKKVEDELRQQVEFMAWSAYGDIEKRLSMSRLELGMYIWKFGFVQGENKQEVLEVVLKYAREVADKYHVPEQVATVLMLTELRTLAHRLLDQPNISSRQKLDADDKLAEYRSVWSK